MFWLIGAFAISTALYIALLRRLRKYRIRSEGDPGVGLRALWTGRALHPEFYSPEGRQLLPYVALASLVSTLSLLAIGVALVIG